MLSWALLFLIVAIIAGVLGFSGIAGTASSIAKVLFVVFLVVFLISLISGRAWGMEITHLAPMAITIGGAGTGLPSGPAAPW